MPIPPNNIIIEQVKTALIAEGMDLSKAPYSEKFIEIMVEKIVDNIKLATVSTVVTGTLPSGPVAAVGSGTIV